MLEKAVVPGSGGKDAALALSEAPRRGAGRSPSDTVPIPAVCSNMDYEARLMKTALDADPPLAVSFPVASQPDPVWEAIDSWR